MATERGALTGVPRGEPDARPLSGDFKMILAFGLALFDGLAVLVYCLRPRAWPEPLRFILKPLLTA